MALLVNAKLVEDLLKMKDAIELMEQAFVEWGSGGVTMPLRHVIEVTPGRDYCGFMPAYLQGMGALGLKVVTLFKDNPTSFRLPSILATSVLLDERTGRTKCIMDANYLTAVRTAAVSGVATKHLGRPDASVLGVVGSGVQATAHIRAVCEVRDIKEVRVYSPHLYQKWESFVQRIKDCSADVITQARNAEEAVRLVDVVCVATTATTPVINAQWLSPGVHLNVIGSHTPSAREVDTETVLASRLVCESLSSCLKEAGDIVIPIEEGKLQREDVQTELSDVVLGHKPGRLDETDITLFKSTGLAFEDVALMKLVYDRACETGEGVPFEFGDPHL
ncbi:MAG: ornithine cyclodeaminase family protein [Planctomycetota bacterium]|nr:ornithine cyclodeaminase family protein [Planctomycetota bacterium]